MYSESIILSTLHLIALLFQTISEILKFQKYMTKILHATTKHCNTICIVWRQLDRYEIKHHLHQPIMFKLPMVLCPEHKDIPSPYRQ